MTDDSGLDDAGNAARLAEHAAAVRARFDRVLGNQRPPVLDVLAGPNGLARKFSFTEKELRVIRFCIDRTLETL